jgi:polar amino acid transport system substrate-binding protein
MSRKCLAAICALAISVQTAAQEYKVVVPQLSPSTTELYKELAAALLEAAGAKSSIEVLPFARAILTVENKQADMLLLVIENPYPAKVAKLPVDYSTANLFELAFVLYTNKAKPVSVADLKNGNPGHLLVETDLAHVDYFPFQALGSTAIDSSLKKLALGRIDAYIFAQPSTDAAIKRLQIKNVSRQFYAFYNTKVILQKGARGGSLDKLITSGLKELRASGKYQQLMGEYFEGASKYIEWQP